MKIVRDDGSPVEIGDKFHSFKGVVTVEGFEPPCSGNGSTMIVTDKGRWSVETAGFKLEVA